jgi:hypothetical protein
MFYPGFMFSRTQIKIYICFMLSHTHTHTHIHICFSSALLLLHYALLLLVLLCVDIYAVLLLYSGLTCNIYIICNTGLTYNIYNICNIGIYSCLESCEQKLFILKHFKALLRHLTLVFEGLPRLKHVIVRLY